MDFANDERIKYLNEQIQTEKDPERLMLLVDELLRLTEPRSAETSPLGETSRSKNVDQAAADG